MNGGFQCDVFQIDAFQNVCGVAQSTGVIGGDGHPTSIYWGRPKLPKRRKLDDLLDRVVEEIYSDVITHGSDAAIKEAAKIVKPFAEDNRKIPLQIDWAKLEDDLTKVKALLALWEEEILENDDEEVLFMLQ